ncbi:hypothetical protein ABPG74_018891 [Tetrahymena malaccensis]
MKKLILILALLFVLTQAQEECPENAEKILGVCDCKSGYFFIIVDGQKVCQPCGSDGAAVTERFKVGKDASFCNTCQRDYFMTKAADQASKTPAQCSKCPDNAWSPVQTEVGTIDICRCYDSNAEKLSDTVQTCACKKGYTGNVSGSFKEPSGCQTACAENASKHDGGCACNEGYYGKDASYGGKCEQCPQFTISNKCNSKGDCNTGDNGDIRSCNRCIENYFISEIAGGYGDSKHAATCTPCIENAYNERGAGYFCKCFDKNAESLGWGSKKCECKYGYTGNVATSMDGPGCVKEESSGNNSNSGSSGSNNNNSGSSSSNNNNSGSSGSNGNSGSSGNNSNSGSSSSNNNNSGSSNNNQNSEKNDNKPSESQSVNAYTSSKILQILAYMMLLSILI